MTDERIEGVKSHYAQTDYVKQLKEAYVPCQAQTEEASLLRGTGHRPSDPRIFLRLSPWERRG